MNPHNMGWTHRATPTTHWIYQAPIQADGWTFADTRRLFAAVLAGLVILALIVAGMVMV